MKPKSVIALESQRRACSCTLGLRCLNAAAVTWGANHSREADSARAMRQLAEAAPFLMSPNLSTKSVSTTSHEVLRQNIRNIQRYILIKFYFKYISCCIVFVSRKFHFKYIFLLHCLCLSLDNCISNNICFYIFLNLITFIGINTVLSL